LYTATDDYVGGHLTGPTVPDKYRKLTTGDIILNRHCIIGAGSVLMPCTLGVAASVGALSFVNKDVAEFDIVAGIPAVRRASRPRTILDFEQELREVESKAIVPQK
jgi:acetyltransferase-like isoleucine patch superfamily enzyme